MKAGIIAAGSGERLRPVSAGLPKPMILVAGRPLCHWTASALVAAGTDAITLLHNSTGRAVRASLEDAFPAVHWTFLEADTASSWESFRLVAASLASTEERFLLSTVDALIPPGEAARFGREAFTGDAEASLALTSFVDDEKPLWADLGPDGRVEALGPDARGRKHVTCGLYALTRPLATQTDAADFSSLREWWIDLVRRGRRVRGVALTKTIDVDRPEDLVAAEAFALSEMEAAR